MFEGRAIRAAVVDNQNVENVHVQALEHRHEFRTRLSNVSMGVNWLEGRKFGKAELVLVLSREHPAEHVAEAGPTSER